MPRIEIPFNELKLDVITFWNNGLLLTAGANEPGRFNSMTIGWGGIGVYWKRPMIQVAVRPTRHTYQFIEEYDSFTVCAFSAQYKEALTIMGTKSGRDTDKVRESKLNPCPSTQIAAPGYHEAELILECRKVYFDDLNPTQAGEIVEGFYPKKDYHRFYFGEILAIYGDPKYRG